MGQKDILSLYYENPGRSFHIREIARILGISKTAAAYHISKLVKEGLIIKDENGVFTSFTAGSTPNFKLLKEQFAVRKIVESGLISHIEEKTSPNCIILFGSFAKGEYDSKSDIDLFVQAASQPLDLTSYEKKLGHAVNLLYETEPENMSSNLLNNIINGVKLQGFLRVKCENR